MNVGESSRFPRSSAPFLSLAGESFWFLLFVSNIKFREKKKKSFFEYFLPLDGLFRQNVYIFCLQKVVCLIFKHVDSIVLVL